MISVERKCWILTFKVGYTFLQDTEYISMQNASLCLAAISSNLLCNLDKLTFVTSCFFVKQLNGIH